MKIDHGDEVSDISIAFSRSFYLLNFEVDAFCECVAGHLFEVCFDTIPVLV